MSGSFQLLHCETRGQGLLPFFVCDDQGIMASAASNFKLHIILIFLDLGRFGIFSSGCEQEVLDLNFVRRGYEGGKCAAVPRITHLFPHIPPQRHSPSFTILFFFLTEEKEMEYFRRVPPPQKGI